MVESQPSKLLVAGSIPVSRSRLRQAFAALAATAGQPAIAVVAPGVTARRAGRRVGRSHERSEWLAKADVAQLAERVLGKDEVTGSIPVIGSMTTGKNDEALGR